MKEKHQQVLKENMQFPEELVSDFAFWASNNPGTKRVNRNLSDIIKHSMGSGSITRWGFEKYLEDPEIAREKKPKLRNAIIRDLQQKTYVKSPLEVSEDSTEIEMGDWVTKSHSGNNSEGVVIYVRSTEDDLHYYDTRQDGNRNVYKRELKVTREERENPEETERKIQEISQQKETEIYKDIVKAYVPIIKELEKKYVEADKKVEPGVLEEVKKRAKSHSSLTEKTMKKIDQVESVDELLGKIDGFRDDAIKLCKAEVGRLVKKSIKKSIPPKLLNKEEITKLKGIMEDSVKDQESFSSREMRNKIRKFLRYEKDIEDGRATQISENIRDNMRYPDFDNAPWGRDDVFYAFSQNRCPFSLDSLKDNIKYDRRAIKESLIRNSFVGANQAIQIRSQFGADFKQAAMNGMDDVISELYGELISDEQSYVRELFGEELKRRGLVDENEKIIGYNIGPVLNKRRRKQKAQVKEFTEDNDIDWDSDKAYIYDPNGDEGNLDPYRIGQEFLEDLVQTFEFRAETKRQGEVAEIAREIIAGKRIIDPKEFRRCLTKPGKIAYDTIIENLEKQYGGGGDQTTNHFHVIQNEGEKLKTRMPNILTDAGQYLAQRDILVDEMIQILSQGVKKGSGGVGDDYRIFWDRWRPEEYDLNWVNENRASSRKNLRKLCFRLTEDYKTLARAGEISGACLKGVNFATVLGDPATKNLIMYGPHEGAPYVPIGYTRSNLCSLPGGSSVLAMDTLEVGHKHFKDNWDKTRALGLATVQMTLDMGVDYLIGTEDRVAYGLRQAFGNNEKKVNLQRLGEGKMRYQGYGQYSYKFYGIPPRCKNTSSVLVKNWKGGK